MTNEQLIEQIADVKAAQIASNFLLMTLLEHHGCDSESLLSGVDELLIRAGDAFENAMRKDAGLPPRATPRKPTTSRPQAVNWDDLPKN